MIAQKLLNLGYFYRPPNCTMFYRYAIMHGNIRTENLKKNDANAPSLVFKYLFPLAQFHLNHTEFL